MIKKSINKFFQYVVIPLFVLSQQTNADPLESYKLIPLDKNIKVWNLSAYGIISDLENNLTSENIWDLDQKKDLKISYFNPKENYINFEFQINELNLKRKFKPYEKVANRQKLVISTLQNPKINILNDWDRYFFLSLENQNKIKINCYETKNTVFGVNSNCSVNNKSLYLTDINENSMESKFETIGSGISLIKETRNWRRKQTFEAGFEFYTKQSNFKISDVSNNISNDFKYNFPQNKSWFESLIKASYSNAVIMNQHWGFGTTLSSYFLLTSGYNNIYYNQNKLKHEVTIEISRKLRKNNFLRLGSIYTNYLDKNYLPYYSSKNSLSQKSNLKYYITLTKVFENEAFVSKYHNNTQTYSGELLARNISKNIKEKQNAHIKQKSKLHKNTQNLNSKTKTINLLKNKSSISLKQFALNFAKIYDQSSRSFNN